MNKKLTVSVGAIGNLGPETTAKFYLRVVMKCRERMKQMPHIIIGGVDLPNSVEEEGIMRGDLKKCLPYLIREAKLLQKTGVDFIVMICNTLHTYEKEVQASIKIPFVSIVQTSCDFVQKQGYRRVGVIGTAGTKHNGLYHHPLQEKGIEVVEPDDTQQENIGDAIHRLVSGTKRGDETEVIMNVIKDMRAKGAECILLACTDLQLVIPHNPTNQVYDTMELLADRVVEILETGKIPEKLSN